MTLFFIMKSDHLGFKWFRGALSTIPHTKIHRLHTYITLGLVALLISGAILFYPMQEYLITTTTFWAKMTFVYALVINSFVIGNLMKIATQKKYKDISPREKHALLLSGGVSTLSWAGAIVMGLFLI